MYVVFVLVVQLCSLCLPPLQLSLRNIWMFPPSRPYVSQQAIRSMPRIGFSPSGGGGLAPEFRCLLHVFSPCGSTKHGVDTHRSFVGSWFSTDVTEVGQIFYRSFVGLLLRVLAIWFEEPWRLMLAEVSLVICLWLLIFNHTAPATNHTPASSSHRFGGRVLLSLCLVGWPISWQTSSFIQACFMFMQFHVIFLSEFAARLACWLGSLSGASAFQPMPPGLVRASIFPVTLVAVSPDISKRLAVL